MNEAVVLSIQVGMPKIVGGDRPWQTGIFKIPVSGPVLLRTLNLEGDGQADLSVHGGVDKAVLGYSAEHYPLWRQELSFSAEEFPYGAFGENFTISGLDEQTVCVGDIFEMGEALLQVSQPRQPCWKLIRKWNLKDLAKRVVQTGRSGWYFRVLREGNVEAGQKLRLIERPNPEWTIAQVNQNR